VADEEGPPNGLPVDGPVAGFPYTAPPGSSYPLNGHGLDRAERDAAVWPLNGHATPPGPGPAGDLNGYPTPAGDHAGPSNGHSGPANGHGPSTDGPGPSVNGGGSSVNGHGPSANGHGPSANGYGPSADRSGFSANGHGPSVNGYGPSANGYAPFANDHDSSADGHGSSGSRYGPSAAAHGSSGNGYGPWANGQAASAYPATDGRVEPPANGHAAPDDPHRPAGSPVNGYARPAGDLPSVNGHALDGGPDVEERPPALPGWRREPFRPSYPTIIAPEQSYPAVLPDERDRRTVPADERDRRAVLPDERDRPGVPPDERGRRAVLPDERDRPGVPPDERDRRAVLPDEGRPAEQDRGTVQRTALPAERRDRRTVLPAEDGLAARTAAPEYPVVRPQPPAEYPVVRPQTPAAYPALRPQGDPGVAVVPLGPAPVEEGDEATQVLRRYVPANEVLDREVDEKPGKEKPPHPPRAVVRRRRARRRALEWPFLIVFALISAYLIRAYVVQTFYIPSGSMHETLLEGDRVLVNKVSYHLHDIHRGDVIVFARPPNLVVDDDDLIKRVVALPGERVDGHGGKVFVNGAPLTEPYVEPACRGTSDFSAVTVPAGKVWVMGDNRCNSTDSRVFGPIDEHLVVGRAFVLAWPVSRVTWL
jgi:signal peptidase I